MKQYKWEKARHGGHFLMADGNYGDQIGHVFQQKQRDGRMLYVGTYSYVGAGTGDAPCGYSHHKSVQGAKRFVETMFWEPPNVASTPGQVQPC